MSSNSVSEAAGSVEVAVQITSATETIQVNVSTVDGTAIGKAAHLKLLILLCLLILIGVHAYIHNQLEMTTLTEKCS